MLFNLKLYDLHLMIYIKHITTYQHSHHMKMLVNGIDDDVDRFPFIVYDDKIITETILFYVDLH